MNSYIFEIAQDVLIAVVATAVFLFVVWTLAEAFGLAGSARRQFENPAVPVPGPESPPKSDRVAPGRP